MADIFLAKTFGIESNSYPVHSHIGFPTLSFKVFNNSNISLRTGSPNALNTVFIIPPLI